MPKHVFFDLDKTLTPSRAPMKERHVPLFERLCKERGVIVVTGQGEERIRAQIPAVHANLYYKLSQQGNCAIDKDGKVLWREKLSKEQEEAVRAVVEIFKKDLNLKIADENDLFENRGSQANYSTIGFHADLKEKHAYDPDFSKRFALLKRHPEEIARLHEAGIEAIPAGATSIDFILSGKDKGYNIKRFLALKAWKKQDCLYIGYALFRGGNDERVIGVIPTEAVKDEDETFDFIKQNLLK